IITICQLVYTSSFISQEKGRVNFYDFIRDEREMSRIFQEFLYQFMKKEYIGWSVNRPHIKWDASSDTDPELKLLPRMESDIIMSNANKTIIIDAKYYKNMYTNRYNRAKFRSNNLYQLMCYLHNYDIQKTKQNKNIDGILIYPMTGDSVNETYTINNYKITLRTLNLNQEWNKIHDELLNIFITP
ncbi:TPA: 5-methylcytosine-specific restriction endonuclease system specificity protein McrC, partial [Enterobacter hormaechei]